MGQNKDFSLGDSTSDSSEKLLERVQGEGQSVCDFWEEKLCNQALLFFFFLLQKVSANQEEEQISPKRILVLS